MNNDTETKLRRNRKIARDSQSPPFPAPPPPPQKKERLTPTNLHSQREAGEDIVLEVVDVDLMPAWTHGGRLDAPHVCLKRQGAHPRVARMLGHGVTW
jgi:hypothetical protein